MAQLNPGVVIEGIAELGNWKRFRQRGFFRNILVVMSGTVISQAISFCFSPILSRLFGPAEFGVFGTYITVAGVLAVTATLNYTDAMMLPTKDADAAPLLIFALIATGAISLATAIFCIAAPEMWLKILGIADLGPYLWFLPPSVMLLGFSQCLMVWCSRVQAFKETSQAQVIRSLAACIAQAAAGFGGLGGAGLISAAVIAEGSTSAYLGPAALRSSALAIRSGAHWSLITKKAYEYREFALYGCPQNVMSTLSQGIPVLALAHFFGAAVAGSYAFGYKLLQAPLNLIANSVRQVLFQKLSQISDRRSNLHEAFWKSTGTLFAIALVPTCVAFISAPSLFAFLFGQEWREAGHYSRWLVLWIGVVFCNVPANLILRILRHQRDLFLFDLLHLVARVATLVMGGLWLEPLRTIMGLGILGALFNMALILYAAAVLQRLCRHSSDMSGAPSIEESRKPMEQVR